jgi:hypothetical protein
MSESKEQGYLEDTDAQYVQSNTKGKNNVECNTSYLLV